MQPCAAASGASGQRSLEERYGEPDQSFGQLRRCRYASLRIQSRDAAITLGSAAQAPLRRLLLPSESV